MFIFLQPEFSLQKVLDVLSSVGFSAAHWRELGRRLKPDLDVKAIEANHFKVDRCLEEVVDNWQRDGDDPSWEKLAEAVALCREGGGKNVAERIRREAGLGEAVVQCGCCSYVMEIMSSCN